jgi:hypothetical protein
LDLSGQRALASLLALDVGDVMSKEVAVDHSHEQPIIKMGPRGGKIVGYEGGDLDKPIYQHEVAGPGAPAAAEQERPALHVVKPEESSRRQKTKERSDRLPDPGTVMTMKHKGQEYQAVEGPDGMFRLRKGSEAMGEFTSLSAAAGHVTGHPMNGYTTFGLGEARKTLRKVEEAPTGPYETKAAQVAKKEFKTIDPGDLVMDMDLQPRIFYDEDGKRVPFDQARIDRMEAQAKLEGYTDGWNDDNTDVVKAWRDPKDGKLYVFQGFHRTALARQIGKKDLDVQVYSGVSREKAVKLGQESNTGTKQMEPLEEGRLFRTSVDEGMTPEQVGAKHGDRSPGYVKRRMLLTYLHPSIQDEVQSGALKPEYAESIGMVAKEGATLEFQKWAMGKALGRDMPEQPSAVTFRNFMTKTLAEMKHDPKQFEAMDMFGGEGYDKAFAAAERATLSEAKEREREGAWRKHYAATKDHIASLEKHGEEVPDFYRQMLDHLVEQGKTNGWGDIGLKKKQELKAAKEKAQRAAIEEAMGKDLEKGLDPERDGVLWGRHWRGYWREERALDRLVALASDLA